MEIDVGTSIMPVFKNTAEEDYYIKLIDLIDFKNT